MTKKKRPGIAGRAPRPSVVAGSTVAKTVKKTVKKMQPQPQPMKEYTFPVEAWPAVATAAAVAVLALLLLFA